MTGGAAIDALHLFYFVLAVLAGLVASRYAPSLSQLPLARGLGLLSGVGVIASVAYVRTSDGDIDTILGFAALALTIAALLAGFLMMTSAGETPAGDDNAR